MKKVVFFFVFSMLVSLSFAQKKDIYDKVANQICECVEQQQAQTVDDMWDCFVQEFRKNEKKVIAHYTKMYGWTNDKDDSDEIANILNARLMKSCPYYEKLAIENTNYELPTFEEDKNVVCKGIQKGKYYYVIPNEKGEVDTTFVTFTEKEYVEIMKKGTTFSRLTVEWKTDCQFILTFVESNDPQKRTFSKEGEKYSYDVIQHNEKSIVIKTVYNNVAYYIEYVKIKE